MSIGFQKKMKLYNLLLECDSIEQAIKIYIENIPHDKLFDTVEISLLRKSLRFNPLIVCKTSLSTDVLRDMINRNTDLLPDDDTDDIFALYEIGDEMSDTKKQGEVIKSRKDNHSLIYERFYKMRSLKSDKKQNKYQYYFTEDYSLFAVQAKYMEDFTDDYKGNADFSSYYPTYSDMDNAQLRTYFTWRANVRKNIIKKTSLSYVYVYIYEVINNIGVKNPSDGFEKLAFILREYSKFDRKIQSYLVTWLKDYYICNNFNEPFKELVLRYKLEKYYPDIQIDKSIDDFHYRNISLIADYKFPDSKFYTEERELIIAECFDKTVQNLSHLLSSYGLKLDDLFFNTVRRDYWYRVFNGAVYDPPEYYSKSVKIISSSEKYIYNGNDWKKWEYITDDRNLAVFTGYIIRTIELKLRFASNYKYKLTDNKNKVMEKFSAHDELYDSIRVILTDDLFDKIIAYTFDAVFNKRNPDISVQLQEHFSKAPYSYFSRMRNDEDIKNAQSHTQMLVKQGKIIAELEDDFGNHIAFDKYDPTYSCMTNDQLRCYITWRTNIKKGVFVRTDLSYIKLYLFELTNNILTSDKYEVIKRLVYVLDNVRNDDKWLENEASLMIKSYYVYNDFDCSFFDIMKRFDIAEYYPNIASEFGDISDINLYSRISSYKFEKSKLYSEKTSPIIAECFAFVLGNIIDYFKSGGIDFRQLAIGKYHSDSWKAQLSSKVYHYFKENEPRTVTLASTESYTFRNGYLHEAVVPEKNTAISGVIGYIIKRMEVNIRAIIKYKYKLTADISMINRKNWDKSYKNLEYAIDNAAFTQTIDQSVTDFFKRNYPRVYTTQKIESVFEKPVEVSIDVSKLAKIRAESDEIREKLTVEENPVIEESVKPTEIKTQTIQPKATEKPYDKIIESSGDCWDNLFNTLTDIQIQAVISILNSEFNKLADIARNSGSMPEMLLEGINEIAQETDGINDIIIDSNEGNPYIYDDYIDEIKSVIGRIK